VKDFEDARSSAEHVASQAQKTLEQQQKALENQMSSAQKKTTPAKKQHECHCTDGGVSEADLQKKQRENAKLEQRLAKLEKQLSQMCAASILSEKTSNANGMARSTVFSKGTGTAGCGYKHYKPPRKLNKKLIGMVYE
jgi:cell division septum initiation protein DivIVA